MYLHALDLTHAMGSGDALFLVVGLTWGSQITTTEAAWMLRPTPPAWICETRTAPPLARVNYSSTTDWRACAGTEPVRGPKTRPGRSEAT